MNKMNKKGFTLIEMLVVIAIIAILVAIIVPVVSNSTVKAAAATNAANLRSYASEVAIKYLNPGNGVTVNVDNNKVITFSDGTPTAPTSKKCEDVADGVSAVAFLVDGEVVAAFSATYTEGVADVDYFSHIAENGEEKATTATTAP